MIGIDCAAAVHLDENDDDESEAQWIALRTVRMVVSEYEIIVRLEPGDVMTFPAHNLWHAMITDQHHDSSEPISVNISMYFNKRQLRHFKRAKNKQ